MKGDFTRWTFDASKQYSSVRLQQGRVLLDADWNEQLDIMAYRETTANKEIIGLCGVPDLTSFAIIDGEAEIKLRKGFCYVDGILCENNDEERKYNLEDPEAENYYLTYLEVWQHHVTAIEAEELREQALGGPDTTTRTQTYWQVKFSKFESGENTKKWQGKWKSILEEREPKGTLEVRGTGTMLPNDLYRVEINKGGNYDENTTFKWARNNGSMAARVTSIEDQKVTIISNPQAQFKVGDWIEITDEDRVRRRKSGFFKKIDSIQVNDLILNNGGDEINDIDPKTKITTVRIWGAEASTIVLNDDDYITLENGLEIKFGKSGNYWTGDYWLIPTRSQEDIVWPQDGEEPHGIDYHYCPLAIVKYKSSDGWELVKDCRHVFPGMTEVARATAVIEDNIIKGTELSIGVHSYNDSRRAYEETENYTKDNLNIQGGTHLKLNVGFWKDELDDENSWPPEDNRVEGMSFCVGDRPRMRLDKYGRLSIGPGDDGKGTSTPEAWLDLQPNWSENVPANGDSEYVGLRIKPTFPDDDEKKRYGLKVEKGNVEIGDAISIGGSLAIGANEVPNGKKLYVNGKTVLGDALTVASGGVTIGDDNNSNSGISFPKASKSTIKWEAKNDQSDFAYIFFKENSKYTRSREPNVQTQINGQGPNFCEENGHVRLSIGIGNNVYDYLELQQDALDIQGGSCLTLNVGLWDKEITEEIAEPSTEYGAKVIGISFRVNDDQKMLIDHNGNVGIGKVPNNSYKLDVNGLIRSTGDLVTSDAKLKENIQTLQDGLAKILGLRGVSYQWKDDKEAGQKAHIGLVAQEVEDIFPELVSTDSQGMKSLSYSRLIAPLIEAVKEQQGQIEELVNLVQRQQTQIEQLQALNNG